MKDYKSFKIRTVDRIKYYVISALSFAFLGLLFYRSAVAAALCALLSAAFEKKWQQVYRRRVSEKLLEGFRDMLYSICASVAAGRQMPQAVEEAAALLRSSWGEESDIYNEAKRMSVLYSEAHENIDTLWTDLGKRSGLSEISSFADSCRICRKNGGSLEDVCFKSASVLLENLSFKDELKAMIAEKKLEIAVLTAMPQAVLIMLNLMSFSYIRVLYVTAAGRLIMTLSLAFIICALIWSLKIAEVSI